MDILHQPLCCGSADLMKRPHKLLMLLAIAMAAVAIWFGMGRPMPQKSDQKETDTPLAEAKRRTIESELLLTGEVASASQVEVKPEVGGKVREVHVRTGQFVRKGDPLITIDDTDLLTEKATVQTEIDGANLEVDKKRGNYERAKKLFEAKLISQEIFANLEADMHIAENSLLKAQSRMRTVGDKLNKTRILAPSDGTVLDLYVNPGQVVVAAASINSGTSLMTFADLSQLQINSHINQMDYTKLQLGTEAEIQMADDVENPVKARIEFIAPMATVKSNIKGFEIQATVEDPDARLKPGMSVSMKVSLAKASNSVSVPIAAVFVEGNERVVYVRKVGGTERRKVTVGITNLSFVEIKAGLDEGEEILLVEPNVAVKS